MLTASNAIIIDCSYTNTDWGWGLSYVYTCIAKVSTLDNNEAVTVITNSDGSATPGLTSSDVKWFYLTNDNNQRIETIPSNFATVFPNLHGINWMKTRLRRVLPSDLAPYPNLVFVSFSYNMIRELDGNLFQNNRKLQYVEFTANSIREIGTGLLSGLNDMTVTNSFQMYGNICNGYTSELRLNPPEITLADVQRTLDTLCGPSSESSRSPPPCADACLTNCTARAAELQIRVNVLTESVYAPWYYKLRMFSRAVLLW